MVVTIVVRRATFWERFRLRRKRMSDTSGSPREDQREDRDLARHPASNVPAKAEDFVDNVFAHMSPEHAEELRNKAAQEAVRIQMKRAEGHVDQEMTSSRVDEGVAAARKLEGTSSSFTYRTEHKSEHGRTELEIRNQGKRGCATQFLLIIALLLVGILYFVFR
jgi:hypothetical protein